jgi:hypothetical protein
MKKVYIIHGWEGSPDEPLLKWLASELSKDGFDIEVPVMPNTGSPVIKEWLSKIVEVAGTNPNQDCIFVGHSIGCQAILRYLEQLKGSEQVGGVILIAPWFYLSGLETEEEKKIAEPWIKEPINTFNVLKHVPRGKMVAIFSDNDPYVPEGNIEMFKDSFGTKIIIEKNMRHFTEGDGVIELQSALQAIRNILQ